MDSSWSTGRASPAILQYILDLEPRNNACSALHTADQTGSSDTTVVQLNYMRVEGGSFWAFVATQRDPLRGAPASHTPAEPHALNPPTGSAQLDTTTDIHRSPSPSGSDRTTSRELRHGVVSSA